MRSLRAGETWSNSMLCARTIHSLIEDRCGVTAIEYALIAALIAVAAIGAFSVVGTDLSNTFSTIAS